MDKKLLIVFLTMLAGMVLTYVLVFLGDPSMGYFCLYHGSEAVFFGVYWHYIPEAIFFVPFGMVLKVFDISKLELTMIFLASIFCIGVLNKTIIASLVASFFSLPFLLGYSLPPKRRGKNHEVV